MEGRYQEHSGFVGLVLGNESYETRVMASMGDNSKGTSTIGNALRDDSV